MNNKQIQFCKDIASCINKYAEQYSIKCKVGVLAQAIIESNYGESVLSKDYHNYFGLKCGSYWTGRSVSLMTREEYNGQSVKIKDGFRVYDSMDSGVKGYFDFINTKRYSNLKNIEDYRTYFTLLKADGYATSSSYVNTLCNIVEQNNLEQFFVTTNTVDLNNIATKVIRGDYGNGNERKQKLESEGIDYNAVMSIVNQRMGVAPATAPQKSLEEVAREIVRGEWGNGKAREDKLREAGYDYSKGSPLRNLVNSYY